MSCRVEVRVSPRASRDRVEGTEGVIRIWTTAPPTEGQANEAVRKLLAKRLGLAPSLLQIVRGESSRDKVIEIEKMSAEDVWAKLTM